MCWNKDVSLATYFFGLVCAVVALAKNLVPLRFVVFFMAFTTIQLMEHHLWKNLDDPDKNHFWSTATLLVLTSIPITATLAIANPTARVYAFLAALVGFTVLLVSTWKTRGSEDTTTGSDGHLEYRFLPQTIWYAIGWFGFFFAGTLLSNTLYLQIFSVLSCLASYMIVKNRGSFNSYWCYTAVAVWFLVLIQKSPRSR